MTRPDDRPDSETGQDRRITEADRATLDRDVDGTAGDRTADPRDGDRRPDRTETDASGTEWTAGPTTGTGTGATTGDDRPGLAAEPLVAEAVIVDFRSRWEVVQQGFVDDPRNAVSEADKLVDDLLKRLSETFDRQHQDLEKQWSDGEPSTEDLRSALQRYRAFFQRLLTL